MTNAAHEPMARLNQTQWLSYRRQPVKRTTAWITLVKSPLSRSLLCLISSARVRIKPSGHTLGSDHFNCSWSGVSSSLGPTCQGHRLDPRMAAAYSTYLEKWRVRIAGTTLTIRKHFQLASLTKNSDQPLATGMDTHNQPRGTSFATAHDIAACAEPKFHRGAPAGCVKRPRA